MRIKKFVIENYKAIRGRKELTPNGASFFLLGGNGVGKTSAGHAIIDMLTRKMPTEPVSEGENAGYMEFTMDNGAKLIGRFLDGQKPVMEFITPDGYNVGSPKELFTKLAGEGMDFNIDDFLKLAPKPLREKLEKIAGLDLSEINEREAKAFDDRKLAKAQLRDQQGRVQPYDADLVTKEPVSAVEISNKIESLNSYANEWANIKKGQEDLGSEIEKGHAAIKTMRDELEAYIKHANEKIANSENLLKGSEVIFKKQKEEFEAMKAPDQAAIDALKTELANVEKTNQAITEAKQLHKEFLLAQELETKVAKLEQQVKAIREEKEAKIKASPIPAEGVTFSDTGDILIDGLPFNPNQIAASRIIIAGIQIASSMLGDIKYLHFDGAALDKENADKVLEYAESKGLQLCIERPLWEGGELKFEIADHTALSAAVHAPEPVAENA